MGHRVPFDADRELYGIKRTCNGLDRDRYYFDARTSCCAHLAVSFCLF